MKKKTLKRMNLNRETLHTLAEERLETAKGEGCSTCNASLSCPPPPTGNNEASCLC